MHNLVKRYIMKRTRETHSEGVTEDDLTEIKQDISALRFELLEIFRNNGMKTPNVSKLGKLKSKPHRMKRKKIHWLQHLYFGIILHDLVALRWTFSIIFFIRGGPYTPILIWRRLLAAAESFHRIVVLCRTSMFVFKSAFLSVVIILGKKPIRVKPPGRPAVHSFEQSIFYVVALSYCCFFPVSDTYSRQKL